MSKHEKDCRQVTIEQSNRLLTAEAVGRVQAIMLVSADMKSMNSTMLADIAVVIFLPVTLNASG
ncbi:MAG: hypothetical protein CMK70_10070 [Pseudohongiella sp.]|nr:hypothetical protein [Pseudohongiella sp.]|tara:strand:- start:6334 stop:6525 length:192 start_codon:yes stop_codon:yes gene_type:complete